MFDFYYQSGEFSVDSGFSFLELTKDLFVEVAGTFAGAWFAVNLYNRQRSEAVESQARERTAVNRDKLIYFEHVASGSLDFCEKLVDQCNSMINQLTDDVFHLPKLSFIAFDDLVRIAEKIDRESLFLAYRSFFDDQRIIQLFKDLDTLNKLREQIVLTWQHYVKQESISKDAVFKCVQNTTLAMIPLAGTESVPKIVRDRLAELFVAEVNAREGVPDFYKLREDFFSELIKSVNVANVPNNELVATLTTNVLKGISEITSLLRENSIFRIELTKIERKLEVIYGRIDTNLVGIRQLISD